MKSQKLQTIEDYLDELNSEAFRAGVEASLRHTLKTGRETGFNVYYHGNVFFYRDRIHVGTESYLIQDFLFFSVELREEMFGRRKRLNGAEILKLARELDRRGLLLDYPVVDGMKTLDDFYELHSVEILPDEAILFHTHPDEDIVVFSAGDLRNLN